MHIPSTALFLLGAGALTALVGGAASELDPLMAAAPEPIVRPEPPAPPALPPPAPEAPVAVATPPPREEPAFRGVRVPDVSGLSPRRAARVLERAGLRFSVRDRYRRSLAELDADGKRIERSTLAPRPGTWVAPGTVVRARIREPVFLGGY